MDPALSMRIAYPLSNPAAPTLVKIGGPAREGEAQAARPIRSILTQVLRA